MTSTERSCALIVNRWLFYHQDETSFSTKEGAPVLTPLLTPYF